jgi:hypothetical protein
VGRVVRVVRVAVMDVIVVWSVSRLNVDMNAIGDDVVGEDTFFILSNQAASLEAAVTFLTDPIDVALSEDSHDER